LIEVAAVGLGNDRGGDSRAPRYLAPRGFPCAEGLMAHGHAKDGHGEKIGTLFTISVPPPLIWARPKAEPIRFPLERGPRSGDAATTSVHFRLVM
jgi:hypothetical protein